MPLDWNTLTIISSIAIAFGGGGFWLQKQFSDLKSFFNERLTAHEIRLLRLELLTDHDGKFVPPLPSGFGDNGRSHTT